MQEAQHASMIQETETEAARLLAALDKECSMQNQKEPEEHQPGSSTPCDSVVSRMSGVPAERADGTSVASGASAAKCAPGSDGKPVVDPPDLGDRIRDTDKEPFWIPVAFPTIFQTESGDPYNWVLEESDLITWGPHVMRSRGWHAQAHMTFMYWWLEMLSRFKALSAKKWSGTSMRQDD